MAATTMGPLQGVTTQLATAASGVRASHVAPSVSLMHNSSVLTLGQRKLQRFLIAPISLSEHNRGIARGVRAVGIHRGGTSGGVRAGGWLCGWSTATSGVGSLFVGLGSNNGVKGQMGFLIDVVKNSAVCHQCRTRLSTGSLASLSSTTTSYYGGGGGRGIGGRGLGGGGGGGDGFEARAGSKGTAAVGGEQPDEIPVGSDSGDNVIILDVGGMSCGGCSASVKRILESQPQVSLANVNLATETAFVQVSFDGQAQSDKVASKQEIGELLAKHLTSCGFKSSVRGLEDLRTHLVSEEEHDLLDID